jgi:NADH:ubiquinone oxidoreductase subunit E
MTENQSEVLLKELSETQQRRHKLDVIKITFVAGLLAFSSIQIKDIMTFYQTLYFVPLVAMFFDLLIMGEHFSITAMPSGHNKT